MKDVHRAGRGHAEAPGDDGGRLAAAPPERIDGPADLARIAGGTHVGYYLSVVVPVRQPIPGLGRMTEQWRDDRVSVLELSAPTGRRKSATPIRDARERAMVQGVIEDHVAVGDHAADQVGIRFGPL